MLVEPKCSKRKCIHFQGARWLGDTESTEVVYCTAFPEGIPDDIAYGRNSHKKPYEGDHGIQFEEEK
jgi:hypothetical protein